MYTKTLLSHPRASTTPCKNRILSLYNGLSMRKKYLEAYINDLYILLKNNTAQIYFISGRAELRWNFSITPEDGFDIHRFFSRKWVVTMCIVGNL